MSETAEQEFVLNQKLEFGQDDDYDLLDDRLINDDDEDFKEIIEAPRPIELK